MRRRGSRTAPRLCFNGVDLGYNALLSQVMNKQKSPIAPTLPGICSGEPGGIRTPGLLLRRQLLYPAELQIQIAETFRPKYIIAYKKGFVKAFLGQPHKKV